jgi:hypothetical protein
LSRPAPPPLPVTGGTGAYEGASGVITSTVKGGPMVEIHLLVP